MWELGHMYNRNEKRAIGASLMMAANDDAFRLAMKARLRRWLTPTVALDLAPGIIILQTDYDLEMKARLGLTAHAGLSVRDWFGVFAQAEYVKRGAVLHFGMRLGAWPGVVTAVALPILGFMAAASDES
jgi:hypothetical protein